MQRRHKGKVDQPLVAETAVPARAWLSHCSWEGISLATVMHGAGEFSYSGGQDVYVGMDVNEGILLRNTIESTTTQGFTARNRIHVLPPGAPSRWVHDDAITHVQLHIDLKKWSTLSALNPDQLRPTFCRLDPLAAGLVRLMQRAAVAKVRDPLFIDGLAIALASRLITGPGPSTKRPAAGIDVPDERAAFLLGHLEDYVDANLSQAVRVADLAGAVDLTPVELTDLLKRLLGLTPYRLVTARRVARAQLLLRRGNLGLAETARQCGFYDQAHMTRHFRRELGVTPAAFRAAVTESS